MQKGSIESVNVGAVQPLQANGRTVPSAIHKTSVADTVAVGELGLAGDDQADRRVHGGPAKAVYAYPLEHYPVWQTLLAQAGVAGWGDALPPGSLGENLTLRGLLEGEAWVGDRLRFTDCELQVTEPRLPCFKLNLALGFSQAVKMMVQSGYCGFYLSVVRPGSLRAGDAFELVPGPRTLSIAELFGAHKGKALKADAAASAAQRPLDL